MAVGRGQIEIVDGGHYGTSAPPHQLHELELVLDVQVVGRLVQHQHRRLLGQGPGDKHPLLLPAGQGGEPLLPQGGQPGARQDLPYQRPVLPAVGLQQPLAGLPPHHDHLLHREIEGGLLLLYHDGKPLGHLPVAHGQQIVPHEGQLPRLGAEHLVDVFEECGFAAAVGADEPDELPLLHPEIHAPEDLPAADAVPDLFCLYHGADPPTGIHSGAP